MTDSPTLTGADLIRDFVTRLPGKPGVYRMYDADGGVIYVGKARNLKNRVSNYARGQGHNNRIALMISLTCNMEFVVTATEAEALLLESNLIKKLKPRFNVILRDDKSFPYILIAKEHASPQLTKHRGARNRKGSYYGPFASAGAVNSAINTLQKAFLLRTCNDSIYANRTRPCLLHQIKRCAAPCVNYINAEDYAALVKDAEVFLEKGGGPVKAELAVKMEAASDALDFETAARLRDRIQAMSFVTQTQGINPQGVDEADVFGLAQEGGITCVQVFFFRSGQNWGN
jgi:excinuclease ABC subunit C